jgi:hypothetical protein
MDDKAQPKTSGGRVAAALFGGLVGAGLTVAAIGAALYSGRDAIRAHLLADEHDRLARLESGVADLAARLAQPPANPAEEVGERVARVESELEQLRRAIPSEGLLLRLTERTESAERSMRELAQSQAASQALLLAVGQLREAVNRGDDFAMELSAVRRLLPKDAPLDGLGDGAAIARRDQLVQRFVPMARQLLDQENEARGRGWWQAILAHVQKVIRLRRIDGKGNDAEAVLGRAEAALDRDDWDQAVAEMRGLPGPFARTAEPWMRQAEARLAADRALSRLTAAAAARTAGISGQ